MDNTNEIVTNPLKNLTMTVTDEWSENPRTLVEGVDFHCQEQLFKNTGVKKLLVFIKRKDFPREAVVYLYSGQTQAWNCYVSDEDPEEPFGLVILQISRSPVLLGISVELVIDTDPGNISDNELWSNTTLTEFKFN